MSQERIVQINVSGGGVLKTPVETARVTALGLEGDAHRDRELQVTRYTSPCANIEPASADGDSARASQKRHPGWSRVYTRVLVEGSVRRGDPLRLLTEREASTALAATGR